MGKKRKGRLKEFQRRTDNSILEKEQAIRKEKLDERKKTIEHRTNVKKKYKLNKIRAIAVAMVIFVIGFLGVWTYYIFDLKSEQNELLAEKAKLKEQEAALAETLKNTDSLEYIEKQAREVLKMVKPDEKLFVIQDDSKKKQSTEDKDANEDDGKN